MALENTVAKYEINVTKTGSGAEVAATELKTLQTQAAATASALTAVSTAGTATTAGLKAATEASVSVYSASKGATASLKALQSVAQAVGFQTFPEVTLALHATKDALRAMRASGMEASMSLGLMAAGVAGVAAIVIAGAEAWWTYKQNQETALSATMLADQTKDFAADLRERVKALREAGEITIHDQDKLLRQLGKHNAEANEGVREFLRALNMGDAQKELGDQAAIQASVNARAANAAGQRDTYTKADKEADYVRVLRQEEEEIKLINDLQHRGLLTVDAADKLKLEAGTKQTQQLTQINAKLTEMEKIAKQVEKDFSSGLAGAIVSFASGAKTAKQAFEEFAKSFLTNIAQMILQMEILALVKAIAGLGGGSAGSIAAQNIPGGSAAGGMYGAGGTRYLAAGGMVYGPTYFPKFNTVAGEAGAEFLSVLSKPKFMEVGGISAVVGNMGGRRIAMTDAGDLKNAGGAGGHIVVEVRGTPDFEGRVVSSSIKGAVHEVTNSMGQNSKLARVTRQITRSS